jgi:hypothetical protein
LHVSFDKLLSVVHIDLDVAPLFRAMELIDGTDPLLNDSVSVIVTVSAPTSIILLEALLS